MFCILFLLLLFQHAPLGVRQAYFVAPNVDISLQSGWFWATLIASFRERLLDFRSSWIVFVHVVWGRPGCRLQFSSGEAVKVFWASVSSGISTMWQNNEKRRAWTMAKTRCGCPVVHLTYAHGCPILFLIAFTNSASVLSTLCCSTCVVQLNWRGKHCSCYVLL